MKSDRKVEVFGGVGQQSGWIFQLIIEKTNPIYYRKKVTEMLKFSAEWADGVGGI